MTYHHYISHKHTHTHTHTYRWPVRVRDGRRNGRWRDDGRNQRETTNSQTFNTKGKDGLLNFFFFFFKKNTLSFFLFLSFCSLAESGAHNLEPPPPIRPLTTHTQKAFIFKMPPPPPIHLFSFSHAHHTQLRLFGVDVSSSSSSNYYYYY